MTNYLGNVTKLAQPPHPFYPIEANVVGYLANEYSVLKLLGLFAAGCTAVLGSALAVANTYNPTLSRGDKASILWFVLCESIGCARFEIGASRC